MLSYQNDTTLKARFVGHIERHRVEDRVLQGLYGGIVDGEWKGCAVGCALRSLDDLDPAWPKLAHWLLVDPTAGVLRLAKREASKKTIVNVAALYARWIAGSKPTLEEWRKARVAADAAAYAYDAAARGNHWKLISEKLCELLVSA